MTKVKTGSPQQGDQPITEELKQDANSLKQSVGKQAEQQAVKGRDQAVSTAKATGSAFETAADELRRDENAPDWLASMLTSVSGQVQQMASELEGKEPREMMDTVRRFGRDNPGTFLASMGAVGFAAGRYLRAGAEQHNDVDLGSANTSKKSISSARSHDAHTNNRPATAYASSDTSEPMITHGGQI